VNPLGKRPLGRLRRKSEDNIEVDLKKWAVKRDVDGTGS
jgi:hypothetical protein